MSSREWKNVKVGDVCESVSKTHRIIKDRMVLVNTSDILDGVVLNHELSETKGMPGQFKKSIMKGDILFSEIRPKNKRYAFIQFEPKDYICSTKLMVIRNKHNIDNSFLYYYLTSKEILDYLQVQAEGRSGTFPQITFSNISEMQIGLPPLFEQKAIAATLSCLDDMIELNNRTNKILEEMAQAIFKRWFVDFEFPNEDGEPYKSSGGEMIDSELGEIPNQWVFGTINDISKEIICGKTPSTKDVDNYGDDMPFITIPDMHDKVFVIKTERYLSRKGVRTQPGKVLPRHSVCVSCIATPGLVCLTSEESQTNQQINSIICNDDISCFYTFFLLRSLSEKIKILGSSGSTTSNLNKTQFSKIEIIISPRKIQNQFHNIVEPLFSTIKHNAIESCQLDKLKASLLPKLMSGEIRVPIEEVV
jgi:type I restriction enzyme S subunit